MYQLIFQLQPKNIFFRDQKYFSKKKSAKIFFGENPEKKWNFDFRTNFFEFQIFFGIFTEKYFWPIFFLEKYFWSRKKKNWLELENKLVHNFDAENWQLSIGEVFIAIPALYHEVGLYTRIWDFFERDEEEHDIAL